MILQNVINIGNIVFICSQTDVVLSRVTSLLRLYLINLDPRSIKSLDSAIVEYTYLRKKFRPLLPSLTSCKKRPSVVSDRQWCATKSSVVIQQASAFHTAQLMNLLPNKGFINYNGFCSYANSILQCILCMKHVRTVLAEEANVSIKQLVKCYETVDHNALNCADICHELGVPFNLHHEQDPIEFLLALVQYCAPLFSLMKQCTTVEKSCTTCSSTTITNEEGIITNIPGTNVK